MGQRRASVGGQGDSWRCRPTPALGNVHYTCIPRTLMRGSTSLQAAPVEPGSSCEQPCA